MDKRGDIGSIVREASMIVILGILKEWVRASISEKGTKLIVSGELI